MIYRHRPDRPRPALGEPAKQLVRAVPASSDAKAGGQTAASLDQQASLRAHLGPALAVLCATTVIILFVMTGSVVLPVKALIMNLLTLSAAGGLLVLVFQDSTHAIESSQPVLLCAVAFGLSTDYGVFLLGRSKELHDSGLPNEEAVALGRRRTGRIVTFAAALMIILRAPLVPALMRLLGGWNWRAPRPLAPLHRRLALSA